MAPQSLNPVECADGNRFPLWFYNPTESLCQLHVRPHTPSAFEDVLFPFTFGCAEILEQAAAFLHIHGMHTQHYGTALVRAWRVFQTQVHLQTITDWFKARIIIGTLDRINKELLS